MEYFTGFLHCLGRNFQLMYYLPRRTTAFPSCSVSVDILCRHFRPNYLLFHKSASEQAEALETNTATKIDTAKQYLTVINQNAMSQQQQFKNASLRESFIRPWWVTLRPLRGILSSLRDYWINHRKYWAPHGEYSAPYGEHWAPYREYWASYGEYWASHWDVL